MNKREQAEAVAKIFNATELITIANLLADAARYNESEKLKYYALAKNCRKYKDIFYAAYMMLRLEEE